MCRLPVERRQRILALVAERGTISVSELAKILNVSEMTIRRDTRVLADEGRLLRHHGWVSAIRTTSYEPPYFLRRDEELPDKVCVGRQAALTVQPREMIFLDVGNTTLEMAKHLPEDQNITVVTSFIPIAVVLSQKRGIHVYLLGGTVRPNELSVIGPSVHEALQAFHVHRAFIGVGGITLGRGITDYTIDEVAVKRTVIQTAQHVVVLAHAAKFGRTAPIEVCPFSNVHEVITSEGAPPDMIAALESRGIQVVVARRDGGQAARRGGAGPDSPEGQDWKNVDTYWSR